MRYAAILHARRTELSNSARLHHANVALQARNVRRYNLTRRQSFTKNALVRNASPALRAVQ